MFKHFIEKVKYFFKKDAVLFMAVLLAVVSSMFSVPRLDYIDFQVLSILFCLMLLVAGFQKMKVLDFFALYVLVRCSSVRAVAFGLVGLTFFSSMLVTNDVSLLTFVPLAITVGRHIKQNMAKIIIIQTLAANLGSALTPMGSPQNLFLFTYYQWSLENFLATMLPLVLLSAIILFFMVLFIKNRKIVTSLNEVTISEKRIFYLYVIAFAVCIMAIAHLFAFKWALVVTVLIIILTYPSLFRLIDYSLLFTFCVFFVFIGNLAQLSVQSHINMQGLNSPVITYLGGIVISQIISNVPSAMLLANFTEQSKALILGVNVGGLGTLIASMASVISYKIYIAAYPKFSRKYLLTFTLYNLITLLVLVPLVYYFSL